MPISPAAARVLARLSVTAGTALREERLRRGLTLREVAQRARVSVALVQGIETGSPGSLETYARLFVALDLWPELLATDRRRRRSSIRDEDPVHAAMGEAEASRFRAHGFSVALDEPYQHFQFAGRADVVAWSIGERALLHVENRTRFPNIQEALGSYAAKRAYLPAVLADRLDVGRAGWRSVTHAIVGLWSAEIVHSLRLRTETFRSACPDPPNGFEAWWAGRIPPGEGTVSTLVLFDPAPSVARALLPLAELDRARPRYRGYADALGRLLSGPYRSAPTVAASSTERNPSRRSSGTLAP